jgi:CDGSH-type Zn-finger protein
MNQPEMPKKQPYTISLEAGNYWWCSCGRSKNQPFCDGSHEGTDFTPVELVLTEKTTVSLCGCKRTSNPPYCDGTHETLDNDRE